MNIFIRRDLISLVGFGANCLIKEFDLVFLLFFFKLTMNDQSIAGNFPSSRQFWKKECFLEVDLFDQNYKHTEGNSKMIQTQPHPTLTIAPWKDAWMTTEMWCSRGISKWAHINIKPFSFSHQFWSKCYQDSHCCSCLEEMRDLGMSIIR